MALPSLWLIHLRFTIQARNEPTTTLLDDSQHTDVASSILHIGISLVKRLWEFVAELVDLEFEKHLSIWVPSSLPDKTIE